MSRVLLIAAMALLVAWSTEASANLIVNGDFDTGTLAPWAVSGAVAIDPVSNSGCCDAAFFVNGTLSQSIPTAGTNFILSFALNNGSSDFLDSSSFTVSFDGNQVASFNNFNSNFGLGYFITTLPVSTLSSLTLLSFTGASDTGDWMLDDVSLNPVAVPEPPSLWMLGGALALLFSLSFSIAPRLRITPKSDLM